MRIEYIVATISTFSNGPILVSLVTMSKWPVASERALDKLIRNWAYMGWGGGIEIIMRLFNIKIKIKIEAVMMFDKGINVDWSWGWKK